ncbi:MAG: tRNA (adenosine(37)-N6)-threonylcarbamoyltransferase complex ATPase subunit type 1 TsaE [Rhodobacteraceae bacterium]|nr:tRNA (adenosine(37)-N6)-threonylcarbamoyltransferase complex ATPase subunit type 1 TsaE [Paracoccaceae bacterium]
MDFTFGPIDLVTEDDTRTFAARLAPLLKAGDCLLLNGPIGAGKSAFARAIIRARLGEPWADVPSPTYTLVQTYDFDDVQIWHADLYRLSHQDEVAELGLEDAFDEAICLIEWPEKLGDLAPPTALHITLAALSASHRLTMTGPAAWRPRLAALS